MRPTLLVAVVLLAGSALAAEPTPTVYTVATSHLDTQWRWTIQTTIDEYLLATLDDNFALLEQYPDYVFNFEGAFRYQLMKEYYPERFERLKEYVKQGRWRVCGSWLDAVDVNMPSPESLYRHVLYANGWYDREFGVRSVDVFLPDCFGFGYALPSIMAHSGLSGFSTQKLTWGSAYGTPFDLGRWRGVDGSEVIAAVNPGAYVSNLEGDVSRDSTVVAAIDRTVAAGGPPCAFKYYGTGDTGGAPTESSVRWLEKSMASDGPVKVVSAGADQIYRDLTPEEVASLPVYDGELVMTSHGAGCYTSQAAMKRWNRRCEVLGDAAERAATLAWWMGAREYPREELERAWTRFLWHGFHDDLTGTSIPEAYAFSWNDMLLSQREFAQVLESSLEGIAAGLDTEVEGRPLVVFNPLGHDRSALVVLRSGFLENERGVLPVYGPDGSAVRIQRRGRDDLVFEARVPANGVAVFAHGGDDWTAAAAADEWVWNEESLRLDSPRYRIQFSAAGLTSLVDKRSGRELLSAPPRLQLLHDEPENWAAWEIDYDDIMAAPYAEVPLGGIPETVNVGPLFGEFTFIHQAAGSTFRQTLIVTDERLDWHLDIDWATKATLLKAAFFTAARDTQATYDLGLGTIKRGLNRPRLYEVPAQRWADVTDVSGEFGLTIMNDGRHGWDRPDDRTIRLSLIHTPAVNAGWRWVDDQKSQDLGRHRLTIGMMGHGKDWQSTAVRQADELNQPCLTLVYPRQQDGPWGRSVSLLRVGGATGPDNDRVAARAIKKSEEGDWLVVRVQETTGRGAEDLVVAPLAPAAEYKELRADEVQIVAGGDVDLRGGALVCDLAAYQPRTFALHLAPPPPARRLDPPRSVPIDLPWNLDGISSHDHPIDGDIDGQGHTLPESVVPREFTRDGVVFRTGAREPGASNLVRCEGQTIALPQPGLPCVQVILTSLGSGRRVTFGNASPHNHHSQGWVPDGTMPFGQWDNRLVGDDTVHDPQDISPAYVMDGELGWVATHRRTADGEVEPYVYTHFYKLRLNLQDGATSLVLPDDPSLVILAATQTDVRNNGYLDGDLVDRPDYSCVLIEAPRRAFIDSVQVTLTSPNQDARIILGTPEDPSATVARTLVLTEATDLTYFARTRTLAPLPRTATFTRLDPWPAKEVGVGATSPGLATREYLGSWTALPDWTELAPAQESVSATVAIPEALPEEDIGAVMTGILEVPARGVYRFWLSSDDGSRLWIGDRLVADHDGLHGASALWGDAPLEAGLHPITVEFFQHLGGRDLKLEWSGPGFSRQEVPASALRH